MGNLIPIKLAEAAMAALEAENARLKAEIEKLTTRLASTDAILKAYFSPTLKITQHTKNRNG
jgi:cell division protein FtsB